nr:hypothetical protein [Tanacetum cinerariifolium]
MNYAQLFKKIELISNISNPFQYLEGSNSGQEIGTIIAAWLSSPTTTVGMLASSVPLLRCCMICADLSYVEEPEVILDRQDRVMRNKTIPSVK